MSSFTTLSLILLSLWSAVISDGATSFKTLPLPGNNVGPQSFAFDSTGKGFYTGVEGGAILKYTPEKGFNVFAAMTSSSYSDFCQRPVAYPKRCGRPAGIAFNEKTGDLYVADSVLGLYVVSPHGGLAENIAESVDGKPLSSLNGLDVDPTTGVVYFTSLSSHFGPDIVFLPTPPIWDPSGKLYKYDPSTKVVTVLMEGLNASAGCAVSSDGSFVLVSQFTENNIMKYWIKGPKAGSSENFTNLVSRPSNIRRIGSTGNFWVASVVRRKNFIYNNQSAVKVNSNGEVLQTIPLDDHFENTLLFLRTVLSEVNEFDGSLYIGTRSLTFVGVFKL